MDSRGAMLNLDAKDTQAIKALWEIFGPDNDFFILRAVPSETEPGASNMHSISTIAREDVFGMLQLIIPELAAAPDLRASN